MRLRLDDLLANHSLLGMTSQEVEALLGPPDFRSESTLYFKVGYMGFNPRAPMVFSYTLHADVGIDGKIIRVFVDD